MTTDLQNRIAAIKAECEEMLKLSEKATAGPWRVYENMDDTPYCGDYRAINAGRGYFSGGTGFGLGGFLSSQDARFIAHARNVSPAMARATIAAIDMLSIQAEIGTGAGVRQHASNALDAIIAAWPEELL